MSVSGATPGATLPSPEQLPDDPATLKSLVLELLATLQQHQHDNEALRHRLDLLLRRLYGPRSERHLPNQPLLFDEAAAVPAADAAGSDEPADKPAKRRSRPHGRRRLPAHLPREPRHHELTEAQRLCSTCGTLRLDIGSDQSEQLDYRPASLFVLEHFVHKYACPCCSQSPPAVVAGEPAGSGVLSETAAEPVALAAAVPTSLALGAGDLPLPPPTCVLSEPRSVVIAAAKPAMPIARGLPGPGLLAHLIVSKFVDHLPLYRLERIYERQGLFLARSTLCDWLAACAQLLRPLYQLLVAEALRSRVLHTDDTTVKLQDPATKQLRTARFWAYLGDAAHPCNVFDFTKTRQRDGPQQFLKSYQGYLQADAYSGYDRLYLPDPQKTTARIVEVACHAHARRKFYDARGSDALRAHQALGYYRQLYELERRATDNHFDETQRLRLRQELAVPVLEQFHAWLLAQRAEVVPKNPLAEALGYALNNWTALVRYTEAGFLAIDNNVAEREMKKLALGRKNWLFVGSEAGGQTAAVLLSFTSTCLRQGVEPWAYLRDVLTRLPDLPVERWAELLPQRWQAASRATEPAPTTALA